MIVGYRLGMVANLVSEFTIGILPLMEIEAFIEEKDPPPKKLMDDLRDAHWCVYS